jgi:regulator of replication initiation timing
LGQILSAVTGFEIDISKLESAWKELKAQIDELILKNPELQSIVKKMQKAKKEGAKLKLRQTLKKEGKVIHIENFLEPK